MTDHQTEVVELIAEFNRKLREIKLIADFEGYYIEVAGEKYSNCGEIADFSNLLTNLHYSLANSKDWIELLQRELTKKPPSRCKIEEIAPQ